MKTFSNVNPKSVPEAVKLLQQSNTVVVGGGSDLLGMVKEHLVTPDVLVNLKGIPGLDKVTEAGGEVRIGALMTLTEVSQDPIIRSRYKALADAAGIVGTPQIRNAGISATASRATRTAGKRASPSSARMNFTPSSEEDQAISCIPPTPRLRW
jgi:CO/xanthine dehydrogenase FAD-binding subunit